ncbi:MAG: helix-hairpin-helix domain-containing protein [Chromatiales bacterium]|jgi:competence protein ComEA
MVVRKRTFLALLLWATAGLASAGPVNVNTADAETLARELDGVGAARAQAIVAYREAHGPFGSAEDLVKVRGIGEATLANNRENILLGD